MLIGGSCVEIKTEADSNDITECPHDDKLTMGMFGFVRRDRMTVLARSSDFSRAFWAINQPHPITLG